MTRREFILGGMAGIALGKAAKASPIASAIGARETLGIVSGGEVVVNPYVTDGLIGMWDGEWNVGLGNHDDAAQTWVDISGNGRDASLTGIYAWGDKFWHVESVSNRGIAIWDARDLGDEQTVEILISPIQSVSFGRIIAEGNNVASPCIQGSYTLYMYGYGIDRGATIGSTYNAFEKHLHTITHEDHGYMRYYIDGVLLWEYNASSSNSTGSTYGYFANRSNYGRGIDADYFTVRRYNRVLSEDELYHNLMIDQSRFGV